MKPKMRKKKKSCAKKEIRFGSPTQIEINHKLGGKGFVEPNLNKIKTYFLENNFPEQEAQKFYNYFSSVGWLVGGKTPMINWQAAAQNWIINAPKFISNAEQPNKAKTSTPQPTKTIQNLYNLFAMLNLFQHLILCETCVEPLRSLRLNLKKTIQNKAPHTQSQETIKPMCLCVSK